MGLSTYFTITMLSIVCVQLRRVAIPRLRLIFNFKPSVDIKPPCRASIDWRFWSSHFCLSGLTSSWLCHVCSQDSFYNWFQLDTVTNYNDTPVEFCNSERGRGEWRMQGSKVNKDDPVTCLSPNCVLILIFSRIKKALIWCIVQI